MTRPLTEQRRNNTVSLHYGKEETIQLHSMDVVLQCGLTGFNYFIIWREKYQNIDIYINCLENKAHQSINVYQIKKKRLNTGRTENQHVRLCARSFVCCVGTGHGHCKQAKEEILRRTVLLCMPSLE